MKKNINNNNGTLIVRISGGLGNQLFQYAASQSLALLNNLELIIDNQSGFKYDTEYKRTYKLDKFNINKRLANNEELLVPFSRIRRYIIRKINNRKPFSERKYITQEKIEYDDRLLKMILYGENYIEGYWQSEKYFIKYKDYIRSSLKMDGPKDCVNLNILNKIKAANSICLHFRDFDQSSSIVESNTTIGYYKKAIEIIKQNIQNPHYFVFSDNINFAHMQISKLGISDYTIVVHNNNLSAEHADLWLMKNCKHFIIANSTFSWWGAWLSDYNNKKIIAPAQIMKTEKMWWGFDGLIPDSWIQIKS